MLHFTLPPWRGLVGIAVLFTAAPDAAGQGVAPTQFEITARLTRARLSETSGVAVSRAHPGLLWTHNDSGDGPVIYATDLQGRNLGAYVLSGATAVDWEDIALGPCPDSDRDCLYIGDTGDNTEQRPRAAIYIVEEPPPPAAGLDSLPVHRLAVSYANGPQDVEALAVDREGTILLISKGRRGRIELYRIPRSAARGPSVTVHPSSELGIVPLSVGRQVTGAAVSPDGSRLVARTYTELYFFSIGPDRIERLGPPCVLGMREPQGEAVAFLDDSTLVLTSESQYGLPGLIATARCPSGTEEP